MAAGPAANSPAPPPPEPKAPPTKVVQPSPPKKFSSAEDECRAIQRATFSSARNAVDAFVEMKSRRPSASCVHYNLGHKYESLGEFSSALSSYKRFVRLAPRHPRRAAVDARIRKLQAKLR